MRIAGSVVLVTGANRGIGRAFVAGCTAEGAAKVYAADRDEVTIESPGVQPVRLDITDAMQVGAVAAACPDVNILINNAGVAVFKPFLGVPDVAGARREMETNYFGTLAMCRAFAPILGRNGGGVMVNILSAASWLTLAEFGSYSAAKRAELALTLGVRMELRSQVTLVVGVFPGWVDTDMTAHLAVEKASPKQIVGATLAAIAAGEEEVVPTAGAARIKAALRDDPASLELQAQHSWDAWSSSARA